jgi:hypothetical protein
MNRRQIHGKSRRSNRRGFQQAARVTVMIPQTSQRGSTAETAQAAVKSLKSQKA